MGKITDLDELGTEYIVLDNQNEPINKVKIIWQDEIIASAMGEFNEKFYEDYTDYLTACRDKLQGFVSDPYGVSWYTATEQEFDLHDAIQLAFNEHNLVVIVEIVCDEPMLLLDK